MGVHAAHERLSTAFASKDREGMLAAVSPDIEFVMPGLRLEGREAYGMMADGYWQAFPDLDIRVEAVHVSGDTVIEEGVFVGTHTGPLASPTGEVIPPTGRHVELPYVDLFTVRDDVVVSDRLMYDRMTMLEQLGLLPSPTAAG